MAGCWETRDFRFHNSLCRDDGSLALVDLEYFGWEDGMKPTADVLLHPGRPLSASQRRRFRQAAVRPYGEDRIFEPGLAVDLQWFAPRRVFILLNEFHPECWQRRRLAGDSGSWEDAKVGQLLRARAFLAASARMPEA
jgi:hypothetical protein